MNFQKALRLSKVSLPNANDYEDTTIIIPVKENIGVLPLGEFGTIPSPSDVTKNDIFVFTYRKIRGELGQFYWEYEGCEY